MPVAASHQWRPASGIWSARKPINLQFKQTCLGAVGAPVEKKPHSSSGDFSFDSNGTPDGPNGHGAILKHKLLRQISKPPIGHLKWWWWWFSNGNPPQNFLNSELEIIIVCPDKLKLKLVYLTWICFFFVCDFFTGLYQILYHHENPPFFCGNYV